MRLFIAKHTRGVICALFVGFITVLPQFILPLALGNDYKGIQPLLLDDEDIYRARIHEILDGYPGVASPYFHEYKTAAIVVPPINEWLYALPALLFGLTAVINFSKFFLPALLFFLVYLLIKRLTDKKDTESPFDSELSALAGAFLVVLGYDLVDIRHVLGVLGGHSDIGKIVWTRIVNPISGGIQLFAFLLLLHSAALRHSRKAMIAAGILLAVMVGYFFSFAISVCILGASICATIIYRKWNELKALLIVLLISITADIPYWYGALNAVGGSDGRALSLRNGMTFTHAPVLNKFLLATIFFVIIAFVYAWVIKKDRFNKESWAIIAILLAGSMLAFNQQVITGREIWYHHFVQYVIPLSFISIVLALHLSLKLVSIRLWSWLMWVLILMSVAWGLAASLSTLSSADDVRRQQSYAPVFSWLEKNADKDCVIFVSNQNEELERYIPAFTHCDVYNSPYTFIGVSHDRVVHNYLLKMRFAGVTSTATESYLYDHEDGVRGVMFENWDQQFGHGQDEWLLEKVALLASKYQEFLKVDIKQQVLTYRMDYLITPNLLATSTLSELKGLTLKANVSGYNFYYFK